MVPIGVWGAGPSNSSPEESEGRIHFGRSDGGLGAGSVTAPQLKENAGSPGRIRTYNISVNSRTLYH